MNMLWRKCEIHGEVETGGICGSCAIEHRQHQEQAAQKERDRRSAERSDEIEAARAEGWRAGAEAMREAAAQAAEQLAAERHAQSRTGTHEDLPLNSDVSDLLAAEACGAEEVAELIATLPLPACPSDGGGQ
jgi:hypothetical protein